MFHIKEKMSGNTPKESIAVNQTATKVMTMQIPNATTVITFSAHFGQAEYNSKRSMRPPSSGRTGIRL